MYYISNLSYFKHQICLLFPGYSFETRLCKTQGCPVDGQWEEWLQWTSCNTSCDTTISYRKRYCWGPYFNGLRCNGTGIQRKTCPATELLTCEDELDGRGERRLLEGYTEAEKRKSAQFLGALGIACVVMMWVFVVILDWDKLMDGRVKRVKRNVYSFLRIQ